MQTKTLENVRHQPELLAAGHNVNVSKQLDTGTKNDALKSEFKKFATWLPKKLASSAPKPSSRHVTNFTMVSVATTAMLRFHAPERSPKHPTNSTKWSNNITSINGKQMNKNGNCKIIWFAG